MSANKCAAPALRRPNAVRRPYLTAFGVSALTALVLFLPFLVIDKGFFLYCGDFNSQQIPFYQYCQQFVKSGGGSFSWATDLGSGFLNTYSFYNLGSPFFWLSCLLPNRWLPYAMAPLLMLKFGVGGVGAYLYMRRYTRSDGMTLVGSVLYTMSGWGIYNIFFNHFIDCLVLFPYLLAALDAFVYDHRRAVLPLMLALNLLNNYFFFLGEALFLLIYFFVKLLTQDYRVSLRDFFLLVFEAVLGCLLGCLLIFPAAASLMNNPRTDDYANGYSLLLYGNVQQYFAILRSLFVPPDPPYLPGIFSSATIKWTSMTAYLPMVSMGGVIAWCRRRPRAAHRHILVVCLVMALVPILNSSYYAFNSSYYARWYYMPVLLMALATVNAVEEADVDLVGGIRTAALLTAAFAVFGLVPAKKDNKWTLGVADNAAQFWLVLLLALLGLLLFYMVISWWRGKRKFTAVLLAALLGFASVTGIIHLSIGKFPQWENDAHYKRQNYDVIDKVVLPDDHFYRLDAYECYDNLGLFLNRPMIQCFNSTVTPSILQFYPEVGVKRDVSSKPELERYALRGLLSVEYLLTPVAHQQELSDKSGDTGFVYDYTTGDGVYAVFRNQYAVPMGFTYDYYVLPDTVATVNKEKRGNLYLKALGLSEEQVAAYGQNLQPLPADQVTDLNFASYTGDCAARRADACSSFTATRSGFTASITLKKDNLVFFSVPYDEGFTATVNGEKAEVLNVDGGLIAIPAKAGENAITLTLTPKWLRLSEGLTALGAVLFVLYLLALRRRRASAPQPTLPQEVAARHPYALYAGGEEGEQLSLDDGEPAPGPATDTPENAAPDAVPNTAPDSMDAAGAPDAPTHESE